MKKSLFVWVVIAALSLFASCKSTSVASQESNLSEFTMEEDLSWLEGTWELKSWKTDNHGNWEDSTKIYEYELLEINGKTKDSQLIEESKSAKTGKITKVEYTIEKYFTQNNHVKGHFNKVSPDKTTLLLRREFARDPEILFYYTFNKK